MSINDKLKKFREEMQKLSLSAYILPSADAHISEYTAKHWKSIEWISGFTGEAATVVITQNSANLWVDSRFFIQAEKQISGTEFILHKIKMPGVKDFPDWILENIEQNSTVGIDGSVFQCNSVKNLINQFDKKNIKLEFSYDLPGIVWEERPRIPQNKITIHKLEYSGRTAKEKISLVREAMDVAKADVHLIASLDDIAWLYNIRGNDIECNPTPIAYAVIEKERAFVFIDDVKVTEGARNYFNDNGIEILPYGEIEKYIKSIENETVLIDPQRINYKLYKLLSDYNSIIEQINPSTKLKAIKNEVEIEGMRKAHIRDGLAMLKFYHWLENNIGKIEITELTAADKIRYFRSESEQYLGESFETISAYKANAAIVHYTADENNFSILQKDGFYLTDSGGQYPDGTTDITRMLHLSEPTEDEKRDYTNILKGMIQLSMARFPKNTRGAQLDVLARQFIWKNRQNYMHGTGHGVGCFLNVHEGPQSIRMEENPTILEKGMILTNEPGLYLEGKYGIRIENVLLVSEDETSIFGEFLKFETLTVCPIDLKAVNFAMMSDEEIDFLNSYHSKVCKILEPYTNTELKEYLYKKTMRIEK